MRIFRRESKLLGSRLAVIYKSINKPLSFLFIADLLSASVHSPNAGYAWAVGSFGKIYKGMGINTSISNLELNLDVRAFPNPASDRLNLVVNTKGNDEVAYELWDILGRMIKQGQCSAGTNGSVFSLEVADVINGVYLLNVSTASRSNTVRILKK